MSKPGREDEGRTRRRQLTVVDSRGERQRFLRGVITHSLVKSGIEFDDAYTIARSVRDLLADRDEVSTVEIRDLVAEQLEKQFGAEILDQLLRGRPGPLPGLKIDYDGQEMPFSKGVLSGSIYAAGVDRDRAYRIITDLEAGLRKEGVEIIARSDLVRRVDELLEQQVSAAAARRYRLVRRVHRLPRPLVVYLGGASGTGKSYLALELAPLLRMYRVTATDTIRQVMRMVFTPAILPALHRSSFEAPRSLEIPVPDEAVAASGPDERMGAVISSYDEQATRVCVGVRAVVERAIAENLSVLVEGVHIRPGIIPFADLEGACYQVPILLTLEREAHRIRFLTRSPVGERRASRYLEAFDSIRAIHDYLLELGEAHDIPLLDTFADDDAAVHAIQIISAAVERRLPALTRPDSISPETRCPTLLLLMDGLPDRPVRALGGRTPLQAACTPNLDRLAREGQVGLADPVAPGVVPDTAAGTLAVFGQSPYALKRGPVEAIGAGIKLGPADVALRGNFASLGDGGVVLDRRAGRIREEAERLAKAIDRLPLPAEIAESVEVRVKVGTEHRLAIVLRGEGLSAAVHGSDPGEAAAGSVALVPTPVDPADECAVLTARVLALFEQGARKVLEKHPLNKKRRARGLPVANAILTRGAGRIHRLVSLEEAGMPLRLCTISGDRTILGLARWLDSKLISRAEMTANLDTDLGAKFKAARKNLERYDLTVLHLKGADIAAHDQRPDLKVEYLERVDVELGHLLESLDPGKLRIAVASDHATLSESGQHAADPVPVLLWGPGIEADAVATFDEQAAVSGALQRFPLQMLLGRLFRLT